MVVGHVAPEAYAGGTIALVQEGDSITIDAHQLLLQLNVDDAEIAKRRAAWKAPAPRYTRGVLAKFAYNASSASTRRGARRATDAARLAGSASAAASAPCVGRACPCRGRPGFPCAGRAFFFSIRSISRRLLRPGLVGPDPPDGGEEERQRELPEVAEELPVPVADDADAGQVEADQDDADDDEQHAISPGTRALRQRLSRQPARARSVILMVAERRFAASTPWNRMNTFRLATIVTACMLSAPPRSRSPDLAQKKNCMACHAVDQKVVGPAYKDVAAKYAGQNDAVAKLVAEGDEGRLRRLGRGADAGQSAGHRGRGEAARAVDS